MSWPLVKLGTLVAIKTGRLDANAADEEGLYPFFTCSREPLKINTHAFDCDAILIAGNGDLNVKHYNGKFNAYQRTYVVTSLSDKTLDTRYLFYFMDKYVERLRELSIGGVIKYIKLGMLTDAEIPLPPLPEQKRIAAILDKADAIRRKRQQAIQLADDLLRAVFLDMFGDPVTNPKGWPAAELGSLIVKGPTNGLYKHSSEYGSGTRILRIDGFYSGRLVGQEKMKRVRLSSQEIERFKLEERSVVINRVNSREYLGKSAFISGMNEDTVFESNMMNFSVDESVVNPVFLVELLSSSYVKKQILSSAKDAVNQSSINQQDVRSLKILLPPLALQESFEGFVSKCEALAKRVSIWQGVADETCLSITHKAFSGQL
ncbi:MULTISPECIES: restriction endonuclease subunit S [Pseudomonas aeruginosa group]|uniref:restriction endonuclease subunit S n=1 Tax=Pseudomonas aeruginosa group TaxID=136841 RepID=UPI000CFD31BE|nr:MULTISPECIES: restriction endonuclease subunit S [Pseudomonas aeruginosa group]MBG5756512.1 restriction endonuclease subunit S [Pseudomonas aeruginosa]MBN0001011.1 restriction endonuclease subunit S [Pseudomonas aeruginosa]MBN0090623.1 restriction endonuclease subunit S [Pseudomonas aeruginosa]MBN0146723.1 restriction endonuclease subunit S [Pseudomonas aeruginosa]MBN0300538.1 restriction endonuclease subunit S [Pseudomonas aeruginosa]